MVIDKLFFLGTHIKIFNNVRLKKIISFLTKVLKTPYSQIPMNIKQDQNLNLRFDCLVHK